jgi:hypothetical protein
MSKDNTSKRSVFSIMKFKFSFFSLLEYRTDNATAETETRMKAKGSWSAPNLDRKRE